MAICSDQSGLIVKICLKRKGPYPPVSDLAHFIAGYYSNRIGVGYAICVCDVKALVTGKDTYFSKLLIS